jgi:hypothetical protein
MILAGRHASQDQLDRFHWEARAVASLQHPGVVQIFDIGTSSGRPFLAIELCEGGSLASRLDSRPWSSHRAAVMVEELARVVQAAHDRHIVHRDLKPENVLLTDTGRPKVTDFGLAKHLENDEGKTRTGAILGTPSYMAPEQAAGRSKEVTTAADVYGLGAILYRLLTGRPPFQAESAADTLLQVLGEDPVPPRTLNPDVPRDLEAITLRCLEKPTGRRYPSAGELADDLRRFLDGSQTLARPRTTIDRLIHYGKRNPGTAIARVLTVVGLLSFSFFEPDVGNPGAVFVVFLLVALAAPLRVDARWLARSGVAAASLALVAYYVGILVLPNALVFASGVVNAFQLFGATFSCVVALSCAIDYGRKHGFVVALAVPLAIVLFYLPLYPGLKAGTMAYGFAIGIFSRVATDRLGGRIVDAVCCSLLGSALVLAFERILPRGAINLIFGLIAGGAAVGAVVGALASGGRRRA